MRGLLGGGKSSHDPIRGSWNEYRRRLGKSTAYQPDLIESLEGQKNVPGTIIGTHTYA
jgi:hypothetical protein